MGGEAKSVTGSWNQYLEADTHIWLLGLRLKMETRPLIEDQKQKVRRSFWISVAELCILVRKGEMAVVMSNLGGTFKRGFQCKQCCLQVKCGDSCICICNIISRILTHSGKKKKSHTLLWYSTLTDIRHFCIILLQGIGWKIQLMDIPVKKVSILWTFR